MRYVMSFIIDTYNKWSKWDKEHARYTFEMNGEWYAIMEVQVENGMPKLPVRILEETEPSIYYIYKSFEAAMMYVRKVRSLNGGAPT